MEDPKYVFCPPRSEYGDQGDLGLLKTMIILRTLQKIVSKEVEMMFMLWVIESNYVEQIDLTKNQEN